MGTQRWDKCEKQA